MGIKRVAGLAWNRLLMTVDNSAGKGTSGMDKFGSVRSMTYFLIMTDSFQHRPVALCIWEKCMNSCHFLALCSLPSSSTPSHTCAASAWSSYSRHLFISLSLCSCLPNGWSCFREQSTLLLWSGAVRFLTLVELVSPEAHQPETHSCKPM
jgi:hypothetical protein